MDPQGAVDVVSDEKINPDQGENLVLIQPQKVKVKLRPGRQETSFKITSIFPQVKN